MSDTARSGENIRAEDWAGETGQRWLAQLDRFEGMLQPVGDALLARAGYQPGERVLDLGCGGGATTRRIARAVGPGGFVVGLDISPDLVREAAQRAADEGLAQVEFECADAAAAAWHTPLYDRLHSRFGSMFFADPAAAFRHIASGLRAGGRADLAVWAPARDNPWAGGPMGILRQHVELPAPVPHAPGPFAFDDPDYFAGILRGAGFTDLDFQLWQGVQCVGGPGLDAAGAAQFLAGNMAFGDELRKTSPAVQQVVLEELRALFRAHQTPRGVEMPAAVWLVSARRG